MKVSSLFGSLNTHTCQLTNILHGGNIIDMFESIAVLCLLGVTCVLAYPAVQNEGGIPGYGVVDFVHASIDSLPDFAAGNLYIPEKPSASFQLAAKEYDPPLSQIVSVYDHSQNKANDFLHVSD